jgi:UDP-galactopyranose mutase
MKYDYLIIGSGLFGSIFAYEAKKRGKSCLVIEKRNHTGGNIHCDDVDGIQVHRYGAHIFHTSNKTVWSYVQNFAEFNHFINTPIANYKGELYNLPFNMNTFHQMWGVITPREAYEKIEEQKKNAAVENPSNLEEQAISLIGQDIYEKLVKHYTEKQWGRKCTELPAFIIKRLPVRFMYNNNYFNDRYQGIPVGGYNQLIDHMLDETEVLLNTDFNQDQEKYRMMADKIVYTGAVDAYYDYRYGNLEYRYVRFETERLETENYQGVAVMNFTDAETPYTRVIEHKHFDFGTQPHTVISREYSEEWTPGKEPYYPVNDNKNQTLYGQYQALAQKEANVIFGGRLAEYKYYDMDKTVESALNAVTKEFGE